MCCFSDSSLWRSCQRLEKQQLSLKTFVPPPARSAQRESRDVRPAASSGSSLCMEKQHPDKRERLPRRGRALMHSLSNYSDKAVPRAGNSSPWNNEESGFGAFLWIFTAPSPCGIWDLARVLQRKETTSRKIPLTSSCRSQKAQPPGQGKRAQRGNCEGPFGISPPESSPPSVFNFFSFANLTRINFIPLDDALSIPLG